MPFFKKIGLVFILSLPFVANLPLQAMEELMAAYGNGDETDSEERVAPPPAKRARPEPEAAEPEAQEELRARPRLDEEEQEEISDDYTAVTPAIPQTPRHQATVPMRCQNYCSQLLGALGLASHVATTNQIKDALDTFYRSTPYNMQDFSVHTKKYYTSLSHVICQSICLCANAHHDPYTSPIKILGKDNDIVILPLKYQGHLYILQFMAAGKEINPDQFTFSYRGSTANITVINTLHVLSPFRYTNTKKAQTPRRPLRITFKPRGNKFLGFKIRVTDNAGATPYEITSPLEIPSESTVFFNNENLFYQAIDNIATQVELKQLLTELYTTPAQYWDMPIEKPYQALFANAMTFVGVGIVQTEVSTWKGRTDCVIYPRRGLPGIIEFKYNAPRGAATAIDQIKEKEYYTQVNGNSSLIGINVKLTPEGEAPLQIDTAYELHVQVEPSPAKKATPAGEKSQGYRQRAPEEDEPIAFLWDR